MNVCIFVGYRFTKLKASYTIFYLQWVRQNTETYIYFPLWALRISLKLRDVKLLNAKAKETETIQVTVTFSQNTLFCNPCNPTVLDIDSALVL